MTEQETTWTLCIEDKSAADGYTKHWGFKTEMEALAHMQNGIERGKWSRSQCTIKQDGWRPDEL